ncbi:MAG: Bor family protein [Candidatus Kapabacteria bacterium]|nr:Bor family protein [Candidatus Kapabacteria bacterium]
MNNLPTPYRPLLRGALRTRFIVVCCLLCLLTESCYHYALVTPSTSATHPQRRSWQGSYFWGLVQPTTVANDCSSAGIAKVTTSTNFLYQLIAVATAGIVVFMDVQWECAKDCPPSGSVGVLFPQIPRTDSLSAVPVK